MLLKNFKCQIKHLEKNNTCEAKCDFFPTTLSILQLFICLPMIFYTLYVLGVFFLESYTFPFIYAQVSAECLF